MKRKISLGTYAAVAVVVVALTLFGSYFALVILPGQYHWGGFSGVGTSTMFVRGTVPDGSIQEYYFTGVYVGQTSAFNIRYVGDFRANPNPSRIVSFSTANVPTGIAVNLSPTSGAMNTWELYSIVSVTLSSSVTNGYYWFKIVVNDSNPLNQWNDSTNRMAWVRLYVTTEPTPVYSLTATIMPQAAGRVASNPTGVTGSHPYCGGSYAAGTVVTVTAQVLDSDYTFSGWGGDLSGSTNPTTITMSANRAIIAYFGEIPKYSVNAIATPSEGGSVSGGGLYHAGDSVTLSANPTLEYQFSNWSGYISSSANPTTFIMPAQDVTITAQFIMPVISPTYTLTTSVLPAIGGSTTPNSGSYSEGQTLTLTAIPTAPTIGDYWVFVNWSGDISGTQSTITIVMDSDKNVIANFERVKSGVDENLIYLISIGITATIIIVLIAVGSVKIRTKIRLPRKR